jgi:hypothetical protein
MVVLAGVLAAAVRVRQQPLAGQPPGEGDPDGVQEAMSSLSVGQPEFTFAAP